MNQKADDYIVDLSIKTSEQEDNEDQSQKEFTNEMLAQTMRHLVFVETKAVREIIMVRALSSTIITSEESGIKNKTYDPPYDLDKVLTNWFEQYENN